MDDVLVVAPEVVAVPAVTSTAVLLSVLVTAAADVDELELDVEDVVGGALPLAADEDGKNVA